MTKHLRIGFLILAVIATACPRRRAPPSPSDKPQDWVVLPQEEALKLMTPCSRSFPPDLSGYWVLGDKDIGQAETRFQEALTRILRRVSKEDRENSPGRWYAQYAGFFRNGRKIIYVNAVGDGPMEMGWRQRAVNICDGGMMSFGAVLDLDRDAVDSFEFNGKFAGHVRMSDADDVDAAQPGVAPAGASPRR